MLDNYVFMKQLFFYCCLMKKNHPNDPFKKSSRGMTELDSFCTWPAYNARLRVNWVNKSDLPVCPPVTSFS